MTQLLLSNSFGKLGEIIMKVLTVINLAKDFSITKKEVKHHAVIRKKEMNLDKFLPWRLILVYLPSGSVEVFTSEELSPYHSLIKQD